MAESMSRPYLWMVVPLAALAGGMGWGIRGQYGHQTGAMLDGLLVGLVLVMLFIPRVSAISSKVRQPNTRSSMMSAGRSAS